MKKTIMRIAAAALAGVILTAMAAGCRREQDDLYVPPEFVFVAESVKLPSDIGYIGYMIFADGKLFFTTNNEEYDERSYRSTPMLYSMNIDGTGVAQLSGYKPSFEIGEGYDGGVYIQNMQPDNAGGLWVVENWNWYKRYQEEWDVAPVVPLDDDATAPFDETDIPGDIYDETDGIFDETDANAPDYVDEEFSAEMSVAEPLPDVSAPAVDGGGDFGEGTVIRRLDSNGAEVSTIDISPIRGEQEYFYIQSFNVDGDGNIFINVYNYEVGGQIIYVLDPGGSPISTINTDVWFDSFLPMSDGSMAIMTNTYDEINNASVRELRKIDIAAGALGETHSLPQRVGWNVLPGSGDFDFLYNDNGTVYGFTLGQEEPTRLLNWLESDILEGNISNITMLSDERVICTNQTWDNYSGESQNELLILTRTPYSELPQREILTLATFDGWNVREAVIRFNRENPDYRIHVIDYREYSTDDDWRAGIKRLSTELIAGIVPDILDVSSLPYKEYAAKGLLADLYEFIDKDPNISRSDLVEDAFRAAEIEGKLHQLFSQFYINSIVGSPRVLGPEMGWNMDEFKAVLDANPQADMPLGNWMFKNFFLQAAVSYNIDEYIDWANGTSHFDSPHFIQMLEFANTFPDEPNYENDISMRGAVEVAYVSEEEAIASGRQLMMRMTLFDYWDLMYYRGMFGGELVFKGFPTETRRGTSLMVNSLSLAIMEKSPNKDAAWTFVKQIIDKDYQLSTTWGPIVTNKDAFEERAKQSMENTEYSMPQYVFREDGSIDYDRTNWETVKLTQADVDLLLEIIGSASGIADWNVDEDIWNIINDEVSGFFSGNVSAADAARLIQSRMSMLVSERS